MRRCCGTREPRTRHRRRSCRRRFRTFVEKYGWRKPIRAARCRRHPADSGDPAGGRHHSRRAKSRNSGRGAGASWAALPMIVARRANFRAGAAPPSIQARRRAAPFAQGDSLGTPREFNRKTDGSWHAIKQFHDAPEVRGGAPRWYNVNLSARAAGAKQHIAEVTRSRTGYRGRPGFDGDCEAARGMPRCRTL